MGLLLSILVTCVGVIELLDFYRNVKRRVNYQPVQTSIATVHHQHFKELEGVRDRLEHQLLHLTKVPTLRLNSHEDIELEINVASKSRSPSPRRFLFTEKKETTPEPSAPRRHFVFSEQESKTHEFIPEFLIEEQKRSDTTTPRFILKDENDGPVALPLPEKFVIAEHDVFKKKLGHSLVDVDGEVFYRRSPSPFPSFDLIAPRNSICSELLDDTTVTEVDESSRSASPAFANTINYEQNSKYSEINNNDCNKINVILDASGSAHSSTEYWGAKSLAVPPKKSKSKSPSPRHRKRSLSESDKINFVKEPIQKTSSSLELGVIKATNNDDSSASDDNEEFLEVEPYTEEMKNSLDGVDRNKGCIRKKYIKKKRIKNRAATKLGGNSLKQEPIAGGDGGGSGPKPGEPFWVNR